MSFPDTIEIISTTFNNGGFDITWEKSNASDFDQYELYHSISETIDDSSMIYTSNNVDDVTYFMDNADPLIFNYFYIVVSDSFDYSTKSNIYTSSLDPKPIAIHVESVTYNNNSMDIFWSESQDTDFLKYELYMGSDTVNANLLETFNNKSIISYGIDDFDPHSHNYFRIIVYDTLNQSTKGNFLSNLIQPIPEAVNLDPIDSFGNELTIVWSVYPTSDFQRYNLYQAYDINMNDKEVLFTTSSRTENSYFSADNDYETTYFFQVSIIDDWGYEVFSNIESIDPEYVTFIHNYDSGSDIDIGYHGVQTASGKYKMIGKTSSDVIMIGTDRSGTEPWFYNYNYGINESPVDLLGTEDQAYVFLSNLTNSDADKDIRITKTDQSGNHLWDAVYGFIDPYDPAGGNANYGIDIANDISLTADGGYIITGQYNTEEGRHWDIWVLKLNASGEKENELLITAAPASERVMENGHAILETIDGYIILGSLAENELDGPSDIWLTRWDFNDVDQGDTLWSSTWDINTYDYPTDLITNLEGGYTITGYSSSTNSGEDGSSWVIKTDMDGVGTILQSFTGNNFIYSMIETESGDYILAGKKFEGSDSQGWIVSINQDGNQNWEKLYGGEDIESFYSVEQTGDKGFILTGETHSNGSSDIFHIKTDPNGNVLSED